MRAHWLEAPGEPAIDLETLNAQGILAETPGVVPTDYQRTLDQLLGERGYVTQDEVELHPGTPNLEAICDRFAGEHFHDDDEVRFVLRGEGVFDIRSLDDRWMRVEVFPGDLLVVPAGRYHRFFLTDRRDIQCVRLFKDAAGWTPHYRAAA